MTFDAAITTLAFFPLLALSAFFSGAETTLMSLTDAQRERIRKRNERADRTISRCLSDKSTLLSTLLVGNTFVNFAIAAIGYRLFALLLPDAAGLSVPVMTILLLLFGEITPKRLALAHAEKAAPACALLLVFWQKALCPFTAVLRFASRAFEPAIKQERRALSDIELMSVISSAVANGTFSPLEAKTIDGVLRLSELCANDEMTPRVDIEGYDVDLPEALRNERLIRSDHEHLLVFRRSPDVVEGVISRTTGAISEALFIPETMRLDEVLMAFARCRKPLAVVTDEYGGTAGIISPDDILEIIIGPNAFNDPEREPKIVRLDDNLWEIDASASLDEVNRALDITLAANDADRMSGWVQFHAGRIPHPGQSFSADGCRVTVLRRRRRRVTLVRLQVLTRSVTTDDMELLSHADEAANKAEGDRS